MQVGCFALAHLFTVTIALSQHQVFQPQEQTQAPVRWGTNVPSHAQVPTATVPIPSLHKHVLGTLHWVQVPTKSQCSSLSIQNCSLCFSCVSSSLCVDLHHWCFSFVFLNMNSSRSGSTSKHCTPHSRLQSVSAYFMMCLSRCRDTEGCAQHKVMTTF